MKKLKIGIVGLGRVASKTHIPVLNKLGNVEIAAGVEQNPDRAKRVSGLFRIGDIYSCYKEMCASKPLDAVYVCLPNFAHKDACIAALEQGLHVFCEKPAGMSSAEALEITELAEKKGLVFMPGYKKRYAPNFARAKRLIEDGLLGKIIHVQGTFVTPGPYVSWDPKSDWYLDEKWHGVIYDTGCHIIDLLLYLAPYEVLEVRAISQKGYCGYNTPTNLACAFEMEQGILGSLTMGWRGGADIFAVSVHGTAGSITVSRDYFEYSNPGTDPVDRIGQHFGNGLAECGALLRKIGDKLRGKAFYPEDYAQAQCFCEAAGKGLAPPVTGRDAIRVHEFLEKLIPRADGKDSARKAKRTAH